MVTIPSSVTIASGAILSDEPDLEPEAMLTTSPVEVMSSAPPLEPEAMITTSPEEVMCSASPFEPEATMTVSLEPKAIASTLPVEGSQSCPVCHVGVKEHLGRHAHQHLPWFIGRDTACWVCDTQFVKSGKLRKHVTENPSHRPFVMTEDQQRWGGLMKNLLLSLLEAYGLDNAENLVGLVRSSSNLALSAVKGEGLSRALTLCEEFCGFLGVSMPAEGIQVTPPNCAAGLVYWRTLLRLIGALPEIVQGSFHKKLVVGGLPPLDESGCETGSLPRVVDSHVHFDLLLKRNGVGDAQGLMQRVAPGFDKYNLAGIVTNFCFPSGWPERAKYDMIVGDQIPVYSAFGIHPRMAHVGTENDLTRLRQMLSWPRVVALGEVGLDYSGDGYRNRDGQMRILGKMLGLLEGSRQALVIHCREGGKGSASKDCLGILREGLAGDQKIHRHCFVGTWGEAQEWSGAFSNVYFGFTSILLKGDSRVEEAAIKIPLDQILLESDGPYLPLRGESCSHPWSLWPIAERLGELRRVPVEQILGACLLNSQRVYGI